MELSESQQLTYLVEKLTTSGSTDLDKPALKKLKSICKKSNEHVKHAFHLLFTQLEKDHSEVRLAALYVVDELFQRSHVFREMLLENFNDFLELTAETNFDMPLPEPRAAAKEVMKKTLKCVYSWHGKYGPAYKKLVLGYNYLKGTKKMQLVDADEVQTQIQRNALEDRRRKKDESTKRRLDKASQDIESSMPEIKACIAELEACLSLLVPNFGDEEDLKDSTSNRTNQEKLRESGLISHDYCIELDLSQDILECIRVKQSKDNETILENLKDREKLLRKIHFPKVKKWLATLGMCGAPSELLKLVIDLKLTITKTLEKSKDLTVINQGNDDGPTTSATHSGFDRGGSDSSSDEGDFIEVQEKPRPLLGAGTGHLNRMTNKVKKGDRDDDSAVTSSDMVNIWKPIRHDDNLTDPASYSRALAVQKEIIEKSKEDPSQSNTKTTVKIHPKKLKLKQKRSTSFSTKQKADAILGSAPVVPFGPDLLEWDEKRKQELKESLSMGSAMEYDIGHRFWCADTASKAENGVSEAALTALTTRSIAFPGEFEPVKWSCRAPLPSGRLCPRKDRVKCPFHGLIIPRDANGVPMDPKHKDNVRASTSTHTDDWQDPALLRELKAATGIDLKMPEKRQKRRKKQKRKYENLTDVKTLKDTSRHRLEKKILDPKSLKRVSETMDRIDTKRNFQKFGNNFSYALN